jgi:hypothetical protein
MKKLFFAAMLCIPFFSPSVFAQSSGLSSILTAYYEIKDALVVGDAKAVASAAGGMLKAINGVDMTALAPKDHQAFMALQDKLAYDSRHISESSDINHQREHFTSLSANLFKLAKQARLSDQPIYEDYCPMKKAYWLSSDAAIKNPYFGSKMLTCGKVSTTLNPQ